jgi:hypothetical protein
MTMTLTDEQLEDIKTNYLEQQKGPMVWMQDNSLTRDDVKPREIMEQLRTKYTGEVIQALMGPLRNARIGGQFGRMAERMLERNNADVALCDSLIAGLQDALVTVNAKKAELEA